MRKLLCIMFVLMLCTEALGDVAINETNFPDSDFRTYVRTNFDKDSDGNLSDTEIRSATYMNIGAVSSVKGLEYFTYLSELVISSQKLNGLDLSSNTLLQTLTCTKGKLTSLNLSKNTALKVLNCSNNLLSALDLSNNPALTTLTCSNNRLAALDITNNPALTSLTCSNNYISTLDTSKSLVLSTLDCTKNQHHYT